MNVYDVHDEERKTLFPERRFCQDVVLQKITKLNVVRKFCSLDLRKGSVPLIVISLPKVHNCLIFP